MHDPMTVAFNIKRPWKAPSKSYRPSWITIWHVDPEDRRGMCGIRRSDDTCGWFTPPYSQADRDRIYKLGWREYRDIWGKQCALAEGKDYARICFEPSVYDAIYWTWRAIKYSECKQGWKYGERSPALTPVELEEIYELASNPIDNLRIRFTEVTNAEECANWFLHIYGLYLRCHRPWYRHPRWHVWHWSIQIHPWQHFRRWMFSRCAHCGGPFKYGESPVSFSWDHPPTPWFGSEAGIYHSDCSSMVARPGAKYD